MPAKKKKAKKGAAKKDKEPTTPRPKDSETQSIAAATAVDEIDK